MRLPRKFAMIKNTIESEFSVAVVMGAQFTFRPFVLNGKVLLNQDMGY